MQEVQSTLPIGTVVRDRYIVEDLLGKGGFGAVYLVRDQRVHHNLFALKEVVDPNKRERARFVFEAEVLKRLDHPALPRVYYVFEDPKKDRAYMLMDYVEGPNLEMLRQKQPNKRFPVQQVLSIMGPIMQAVDYLHQQHPPIIHRDIKPANIIVPTSGIGSVLVDFGIAKEYDPESTTTAIRHASPGYGAPEQYGIGTNTRTDIYGLGATIYALLTGAVPVDAFFRATQQGSKGTDPLEPIHQYVPTIPRHIEQAVYRAMAIDGNARFASAGAFWEALNAEPLVEPLPEPVVIAKPVAQSAPAQGERNRPQVEQATTVSLQKSPRRRRNRIGALLLLVLALSIVGVALALLLPSLVGHHGQVSGITPTPHVQHKSTPTPVATHASTPSPTATATTQPSPSPSPTPSPTPIPAPGIPNVAGNYNGTIVDDLTRPPTSAPMSLSINQSQGTISGYFSVSPPLIGSNSFTGYVTNKNYIQFLVQGSHGNPPLFFTGTVQQNGSMSGNYCSYVNNQCNYGAGGYGTWNVTPSSPGGSGSSLVPSNTPMDYRLRSPTVA
ncbi:MAG TPA: serine/threonine-protein kinase [Ktedonobacteraceae bacterium]|nr:serine/threonine-protein kinase [Ktedonobacteraceae bacterium]